MARPLAGLLLVAAAELPLLGLSAALYASGSPVPPFPLFMLSWLLLPAAALLLAYRPRAAAAAGLLLAAHGVAVAVWPGLLLP
ncbi:MAG: hypothetical protein GXO15_05870, partial [Crenarchaeota archaeon]|nr:hypothetical protein [Thermoproteota archaeon]